MQALKGAGDTLAESFLYTVRDSGSLSSLAALTVTIQGANDAPTAAAATPSFDEDTTLVLTAAQFGFKDVDAGDALTAVKITALPAAGSLQLDGAAVALNQVISKADLDANRLAFIPAANAYGDDYGGFRFKVRDGAMDSLADYAMAFNVLPVSDLPPVLADKLRSVGALSPGEDESTINRNLPFSAASAIPFVGSAMTALFSTFFGDQTITVWATTVSACLAATLHRPAPSPTSRWRTTG